ncbi:MAG: glycosyltransferase family 2 protein [Bacteroidota bacterium]
MNFQVSVILPVYNNEAYIEKAVRSAAMQKEVQEVIVVDDGSSDRTPEIIRLLQKENSKIKLYSHPKRQNLGRSASRNLGIKKASCDFIAFLDADDFYLENRFKFDSRILLQNHEIDGVYNAIGAEFYRPYSVEEEKRFNLTGLRKKVSPNDLFYEMWPKGSAGYFHCDGLTVRKGIFEKTGFFNKNLEVAEDTELWVRMALKSNLLPGSLTAPVAKRGIHQDNIAKDINSPLYINNYYKMYSDLLKWGVKEKVENEVIDFFWKKRLFYFYEENRLKKSEVSLQQELLFWGESLIRFPKLIGLTSFIRSFPGYRRFKNQV